MARSLVDYIKDTWNSIFNGKEEKDSYEAEREKLENFLAEAEGSLTPEKAALPDTPEYERLEYSSLSDDELKVKAESELGNYQNQNIKAIEDEMTALGEKYEKDKATTTSNVEAQKQEVESAYESAKENTSNDVLKRGLARSSIAVNKISGLEESKADTLNKINSQLTARITELDNEISALSVKRETALNDFNIAYASKLTTLINSLKAEQEKNKATAIEYNNSMSQKEHEQKVNKEMKESDLYSEQLSQKEKENKLIAENQEKLYAQTYEQMRQTLLSVSTSTARKMLQEDPIFRAKLNTAYYYKLYDEFGR